MEYQTKLQKDNNFMTKFDIIVLGGCDNYAYNVKGINQQTFNDIKKYHNQNGIILLLHDVMNGPLIDIFMPLTKLIGFKYINPLIQKGSPMNMFEKVKLNDSFSETDIQSIVFQIQNSFTISKIHYTAMYDKGNVIYFSDDGENYYTENLDEHLADCQMGHEIEIKQEEQKFFYNVICNLFEHCKNHNVKTLI